MQIQETIKSNNFGFILAVGAVSVQALHSQFVLKLVSSLTNVFGYDLTSWHSFITALLISGAILYFTLRGKVKIAIGAAIFEAYMNICYYSIYITQNENPKYYLFWIAIPSSIALPSILALFSEEITEKQEKITEKNIVALLKDKTIKMKIKTNEGVKTVEGKIL